MKEVVAPFIELTTEQAGKLFGTSAQVERRRCEQGLRDCFRTDGGQWRIKIRPNDVVSREEAEALRNENATLKAKLEAAQRVLTS